jgi:hypothetical protein
MLRHLFLHIHKVGGTSVVENLWKPAFPLHERHVEEDFHPGAELYGHQYTYKDMYVVSQFHGLPYQDVFTAYVNGGKVPRHCRLYSGHMCYGVHRAFDGPYRYSTILRHPVERTLSHFHLVKSLGGFDGDFAAYLERGGPEVANYQCKMLTPVGFCHGYQPTEGDLHAAIHRLDTEFDFAVTEHIDAFIDGMIEKYRLPIENRCVVVNRTDDAATVKAHPQFEHRRFPVDPQLLPRLAELNVLDMRFYEFAKRESTRRWLGGVTAS